MKRSRRAVGCVECWKRHAPAIHHLTSPAEYGGARGCRRGRGRGRHPTCCTRCIARRRALNRGHTGGQTEYRQSRQPSRRSESEPARKPAVRVVCGVLQVLRYCLEPRRIELIGEIGRPAVEERRVEPLMLMNVAAAQRWLPSTETRKKIRPKHSGGL